MFDTTAQCLHLETFSTGFPPCSWDASSQLLLPGPSQGGLDVSGSPGRALGAPISEQCTLFLGSARTPQHMHLCVSHLDLSPKQTPRYPTTGLSLPLGCLKDTHIQYIPTSHHSLKLLLLLGSPSQQGYLSPSSEGTGHAPLTGVIFDASVPHNHVQSIKSSRFCLLNHLFVLFFPPNFFFNQSSCTYLITTKPRPGHIYSK